MPDYARGKIYKITSGELTYIGSTTEPTLAKRLVQHVSDYKRWKTGKYNKVTSFQVIELGNYDITLLELCACGSKDELTARERHWVETIPCVNKFIPGQTNKEWNDKNKVLVSEMKKVYYEDHKAEIKGQRKKYRDNHKEELKEQKKAFYQLNKEKILAKLKEKRFEKNNLPLL